MIRFFVLIASFLIATSHVYAQSEQLSTSSKKSNTEEFYFNWYNKDIKSDKYLGLSTEKAYSDFLQSKESSKVIVAVIDAGVDIYHEDLQGKIWVNKGEIPNNGIDDDGNGYIDDVYGWNFLGNADGENVEFEQLEITRQYKEYVLQGEASVKPVKSISDRRLIDKIETMYNLKLEEAEKEQQLLNQFQWQYYFADSIIKANSGLEKYSLNELKKLKGKKNSSYQLSLQFMKLILKEGYTKKDFDDYLRHTNDMMNYHLNPEYEVRYLVGDDISDLEERGYGNNQVWAKAPDHGTFIAGIIAAERSNDIGIDGIADNVLIMPIRAIPNGDERDKDVANAIYYAVDNGAQIINMSFGKELSPNKMLVDEALKYANDHDVLVVHAAGNESSNNDIISNYPNNFTDNLAIVSSTWIEVGASTYKPNKQLVGSFSNYGDNSVDVFAPGVDIYSLQSGNKYELGDGTSYAAPMVSGLAALIMSYYPEFSASEVKTIILESSIKKGKLKVNKPSKDGVSEKVPFNTLSKTGGIINAYEAIKLAEKKSSVKK